MMTKELLLKLFGISDAQSDGAKSVLESYDDTISRIMLVTISEFLEKNQSIDTSGIKDMLMSIKNDSEVEFDQLQKKMNEYGDLLDIFNQKVSQYHDTIFSVQIMQMQDFELDELSEFLKEVEGEMSTDEAKVRAMVKEKIATGNISTAHVENDAKEVFDFSVFDGSAPESQEKKDNSVPEVNVLEAIDAEQANEPQVAEPEKVPSSEAIESVEPVVEENPQSTPEQVAEPVQSNEDSEAKPVNPPPMNLGGNLNQTTDQNNPS